MSDKTADEKTSLQALALINDCNKIKCDISTSGVIITDAIKYVNGKMDHLNTAEKKLLQDINLKQKEDTESIEDIDEELKTEIETEQQQRQLELELEQEQEQEQEEQQTNNKVF